MKTEKIRVACLINTAYAGSTMMTFLMNSHPQIISVGEGVNRRIFRKNPRQYYCSCGDVLIECSFWKQVAHLVREQGLSFEVEDLNLGYKYQNKFLRQLFCTYYRHPKLGLWGAQCSRHIPGHATRIRRVGRINVAFMRASLDISGADVFFSAGKNLMGHYHLVARPELDVKFIRIVRDVRSFAGSYKLKRRSVAEATAVWLDYQTRANYLVESLPEESVIVVRYEDLYADPATWLGSIYDFLGVAGHDLPEVFIPKEHHVTGNKIRLEPQLTIRPVERWKTILTDVECQSVIQVAGEMNQQFGYLS